MKDFKSDLVMALRAEENERTLPQMRAIGKAASAVNHFGIDHRIKTLSVSRADSLEQYRGTMREPENLEWLVNGKFNPADYHSDESDEIYRPWHFHEVMEEVRKCIMLGRWDAEHSDDVDEQQRRINYNNREAFYELTVRQMAVEFHEHWSKDPVSAIAVQSLFEAGLLDEITVDNVGDWEFAPFQGGNRSAISLLRAFEARDDGKPFGVGTHMPIGMLMLSAYDANREFARGLDVGNGSVAIESSHEINQTPKPDVQWLVEGVIPKTVDPDSPYVGFLYGNSGTYKSFIATGICAAIARGADGAAGFAGLAKVNGVPGKVMYLSGEDSYGIRIRFEAEAGGIVPDCVRMNLNELDGVFGEDGNFDPAIVRCVIEHEPDLVVMDTMNSLKLCDNNNSSASVSKMMHKLKELGTTVMVVHHTTKSGDSMEGSHAMTSNADFIMRTDIVEREDDIPVVDLSCGKLKNAAKFKPMRIELVDKGESLVCCNHSAFEESRGKSWDDMTEYEKVIHFLDEYDCMGASIDEILERLGVEVEDESYEKEKRNLRERLRTWIAKGSLIRIVESTNVGDKRHKNYSTKAPETTPDLVQK